MSNARMIGARKRAAKNLKRYGVLATVYVEATGAVDRFTGAESGSDAESDFPMWCVKTRFSKYELTDTVLNSDIRLICEWTAIEPAVGMRVEIGEDQYRVINAVEVRPGETGVIRIVQVRK